MSNSTPIYGLLAEFEGPEELVTAAQAARAEGYRKLDAYTPFPVEGLAQALGFHRTGVSRVALLGGIVGCVGGFWLQYWCAAIDYPLNLGGRPLDSWPSFIPVTFELTVLGAAMAAVVGLFALNGLPMPYHPVFNVPRFALASRDRFFLCIEAADPRFDRQATQQFLMSLRPKEIAEVPP
jgi:hypothetical protein